MPKSSYQIWEARELLPFLQRVFPRRVSRGDIPGRIWDRAWYRVVQSARHHVTNADMQGDYSPTPFLIVEQLYQALIDPSRSTRPTWACMSIESCAIVFVQHAKTYGPYLLHSRSYVWPAPEYVFSLEQERAIERQRQRQWHSDENDREREALHQLFHQGQWLQMVDQSVEQDSTANFGFETPERARKSYEAFESGRLMFGGIYKAQDLAEDVRRSAAPFPTVANRTIVVCDYSRSSIRRSSV